MPRGADASGRAPTADSRLLVITGAAGRIGSFYRRHLQSLSMVGPGPGKWRLRLVDVRPPRDVGQDDEVVVGEAANLADLDAARRSLAGAHSVLHLAAEPHPRAEFYSSLLDRNIKATYNVLCAAAEGELPGALPGASRRGAMAGERLRRIQSLGGSGMWRVRRRDEGPAVGDRGAYRLGDAGKRDPAHGKR
jgi:hypothetical protein